MDNKLIEFRCSNIACDKLLAKCDKAAFLEIKCKSCKNYSFFIGGKSISIKEKSEMDFNFLQATIFGK